MVLYQVTIGLLDIERVPAPQLQYQIGDQPIFYIDLKSSLRLIVVLAHI